MLTVPIPTELAKRLNRLVEETFRPASFYLHQALEEFLDEHEDYLIAQTHDSLKKLRMSSEKIEKILQKRTSNKQTSKVTVQTS